jgi:hypothetical protein
MTDMTAEYCEQRMREEKRAAALASSREAAHIHQRLAREFEKKASALRAGLDGPDSGASQALFPWRPHQ